jgi:hypothetical protein
MLSMVPPGWLLELANGFAIGEPPPSFSAREKPGPENIAGSRGGFVVEFDR